MFVWCCCIVVLIYILCCMFMVCLCSSCPCCLLCCEVLFVKIDDTLLLLSSTIYREGSFENFDRTSRREENLRPLVYVLFSSRLRWQNCPSQKRLEGRRFVSARLHVWSRDGFFGHKYHNIYQIGRSLCRVMVFYFIL